jgi:hypothetical protein
MPNEVNIYLTSSGEITSNLTHHWISPEMLADAWKLQKARFEKKHELPQNSHHNLRKWQIQQIWS